MNSSAGERKLLYSVSVIVCFYHHYYCPLRSIKLHVMKLKGYFEQVHQLNGDTEKITESIVNTNALKGIQLFPKLLMQILTNYFHNIYIFFFKLLLYCN